MRQASQSLAWLHRAIALGRRPAPSAIVGGVALFLALAFFRLPLPGLIALGSVVERPAIAFSVLVGPTGLTFPCWASVRAGRRRTPGRPSLT